MRYILLIVWLSFIIYALFFGPDSSGPDPYLGAIVTLQTDEPSLIAMFTLLGLFPLGYACLLLRTDHRRIPAWPFVIGSFALGAFALLPYFIWTASDKPAEHHTAIRTPLPIRRSTEKASTHWILLVLTVFVIGYGLIGGDGASYHQAFRTSGFVHTMTIDFVLLTFLSVYAISRDERRLEQSSRIIWIGLLPVIGLLMYVWLTRKTVPNRGEGAY